MERELGKSNAPHWTSQCAAQNSEQPIKGRASKCTDTSHLAWPLYLLPLAVITTRIQCTAAHLGQGHKEGAHIGGQVASGSQILIHLHDRHMRAVMSHKLRSNTQETPTKTYNNNNNTHISAERSKRLGETSLSPLYPPTHS